MRLAIVGVLGLVILGLVGGVIYRTVKKARTPPPAAPVVTVDVPRAKRDILAGETIRAEDLEIEKIPEAEVAAKVPADAIRDQEQIAGGQAAEAIAAQSYFNRTNVIPAPETVSAKVRPGYVAVTIQTPPKPSLYDLKFLGPDDRVDVFGVQKPKDDSQPTTELLAENVRLLAVDAVFDKYKEEQRIKKLEAEIAALEEQKAKAMQGGVPMTPEQIKTQYDDPIAAKRAQLDAKPENPSVTLEVTRDQAHRIALWRANFDFDIALHRQETPESILAAEQGTLATPTQMAALAAGSVGPVGVPVLTLEDVVPLSLRSRKKYVEELEAEQRILTLPSERRLQTLENDVESQRLQVELRNLQRYGTSTPPVELTAPPLMAPLPAAGGADLGEVKELLSQMQRDIRELKGGTAPAPYRHRVEVIRGTEVEVVES